MNKKEMIELYSTILRQWNEIIEEQRKKCGGSADEPMYVDATFVTDMLKDFIKSLENMENEKAIEFLKHARDLCNQTTGSCSNCPMIDENHRCKIEYYLSAFYTLDYNEIAELVREVERWWEENEK